MTDDMAMMQEIEATGARLAQAREMIARRFIGQERVVELTLIALLCGGHGAAGRRARASARRGSWTRWPP